MKLIILTRKQQAARYQKARKTMKQLVLVGFLVGVIVTLILFPPEM